MWSPEWQLLVSSVAGMHQGYVVCYSWRYMRVSDFQYGLPVELIAQRPAEQRDASRLLLLARRSGVYEDKVFRALPQLLRGDELLVLNNTRVRAARLFGKRVGVHAQPPAASGAAGESSSGEYLSGTVEIFLARRIRHDTWEALVRPGKKLPVGERVIFGAGELQAEIVERGSWGFRGFVFNQAMKFPAIRNLSRR